MEIGKVEVCRSMLLTVPTVRAAVLIFGNRLTEELAQRAAALLTHSSVMVFCFQTKLYIQVENGGSYVNPKTVTPNSRDYTISTQTGLFQYF